MILSTTFAQEYPRGVRDVSLRREPEKVGRSPGGQRTYDSVKVLRVEL